MKERLNSLPITDDAEKEMFKKATNLLNCLPKLEARLGRGGYIADKNGTPCKDGDIVKVIYKNCGQICRGVLRWCKDYKRFEIHYDNGYDQFTKDRVFKKVKDGDLCKKKEVE